MSIEDKNKRGSSGRAGGDWSNQPVSGRNKHPKANHNKRQTGGWSLWSQDSRSDPVEDRNRGSVPEQEVRAPRMAERRFNLVVDSVPYMVKAVPFIYNGEVRYRVSFNGGGEHVFTWDSSLGQLRAINDDSSVLPDNLEDAISEKLRSKR